MATGIKIWGVILLAVLFYPCHLFAEDTDLNDKGPAFIIPKENAGVRHFRCLEMGREKEETYWTPTPDQVEKVEKDLQKFYSTKILKHEKFSKSCFGQFDRVAEPLEHFYRQYAGVVIGNKESLCLNFFPKEHLEFRKLISKEIDWRYKPIIVMDGGPTFWQVEYDLEMGKFKKPRFNKTVGPRCTKEQYYELKNRGFFNDPSLKDWIKIFEEHFEKNQ